MKPMRHLPPPPPSRYPRAVAARATPLSSVAPPRATPLSSVPPPPESSVRMRQAPPPRSRPFVEPEPARHVGAPAPVHRVVAPPAAAPQRLTPEVLAALRLLAPQRRGSRFRYAIALALACGVGIVLGSPITRGWLVDEGRALLSLQR